MKSLRFSLNLLFVLLLVLAFSSVASAQATRTWVSGVGDDVNPCSRTAPCKTFAGAISKTAAGGEIDCLDPGGFGALTITKAITIDCDSGVGGVLSSGTNGIVINANATDVITLRNLNVSGAGVTLGTNGITVLSAKAVHLRDVWIQQYSAACITVNTTAASQLTVHDGDLSECATGIQINTSVGNVFALIETTRIHNTINGVVAQNGSRVFMKDSHLLGNTLGVSQTGVGAGGSTVTVSNSTLFGSSTAALQSAAGAAILSFASSFINDGVAFNPNGGQIFSGGDNIAANSGIGSANGGAATRF